ncbi:Os10g0549000 [Oryza sativa Japonica Group]|uniref:Os10g0549000 protein n=1 Tax=Oryza sativa subsp. japonica TaxID=39947 RepID=A0A0P0XXE7_ORYSJ|nr:hypothetical protein EE612_052630 [Oryza sativa]BAT11937.1 Os10g0549000 [Oryza sativa Japonica Group]
MLAPHQLAHTGLELHPPLRCPSLCLPVVHRQQHQLLQMQGCYRCCPSQEGLTKSRGSHVVSVPGPPFQTGKADTSECAHQPSCSQMNMSPQEHLALPVQQRMEHLDHQCSPPYDGAQGQPF